MKRVPGDGVSAPSEDSDILWQERYCVGPPPLGVPVPDFPGLNDVIHILVEKARSTSGDLILMQSFKRPLLVKGEEIIKKGIITCGPGRTYYLEMQVKRSEEERAAAERVAKEMAGSQRGKNYKENQKRRQRQKKKAARELEGATTAAQAGEESNRDEAETVCMKGTLLNDGPTCVADESGEVKGFNDSGPLCQVDEERSKADEAVQTVSIHSEDNLQNSKPQSLNESEMFFQSNEDVEERQTSDAHTEVHQQDRKPHILKASQTCVQVQDIPGFARTNGFDRVLKSMASCFSEISSESEDSNNGGYTPSPTRTNFEPSDDGRDQEQVQRRDSTISSGSRIDDDTWVYDFNFRDFLAEGTWMLQFGTREVNLFHRFEPTKSGGRG